MPLTASLAAPRPAGRASFRPVAMRAASLLGVLLLLLLRPDARAPAAAALADAYVGVTVFVAATLLVLFFLERRTGTRLSEILARHARFEVPIAAGLGALPGCGGAIAVISQYTRGHVSFGGVVAALTATMGDAAFVLLAAAPRTALLVTVLSLVIGIVSGLVVNAIHGTDFMRPERASPSAAAPARPRTRPLRKADIAWLTLLVPGLLMGAAGAMQIDLPQTAVIGALSGFLALLMWVARGQGRGMGCGQDVTDVINDTNFVTAWVFFAFLSYELAVGLFGLDLGAVFGATPWIVPLIAVLVGFIPGCGPQIVVTSLYVAGAIPLSAQLGNAISNDGDALFPALATVPRAALVATLYSAIPAILLGYGWFLAFE